MHHSPSKTTLQTFGKIILIITLMLMFALVPAYSAVRSARARVLDDPGDMIVTRKANFGPGDILGTPLVSITINNGEGVAYLLLKLKIEFGGSWGGQYAEVSLVNTLASNTSLTFTNTEMLSYITNIRRNDLNLSPDLMETIGISGIEDITSLTGIPEGTYSVTLTASEITLADPNNIGSTITSERPLITALDPNASVSFNVVTIGNISNVVKPTVENLSLSFTVPEIPVYADSVVLTTSSTQVQISGPGVSTTLSKNHSKATTGSSAIKGYPSDLTNGVVTYDLRNIPFRAGETYNAIITFKDWNNMLITERTIVIDTFPAPRINADADLSSPFRPLFSWDFSGSDYSNWVKEYRVYVNGQYMGFTTNKSYQLGTPLAPGTTYTWYVMPLNKDNTPFFASPSAITKTFTTKAHTALDVGISQPTNNAVLFKGDSYAFSGTATFSDDATLGTATWYIGSETKTGLYTPYSPTRRFPSNTLAVYLRVIDSLNLSKNSTTLNLTVLDPALAIQGAATRTVNKGTATTFALDTQNTRDIATYEWFVDGSSVGTGSQLSHTFTESGTQEVYVRGTTIADMNGNTKTIESQRISVTVVGVAPTVAITQPTASVDMILGNSLNIIANIVFDNTESSVTWTIAGPDTSQSGSRGNQLNFTPRSAGEYTVTVQATDTQQKTAQASTRVFVINPVVTITSPLPNAVFALTSNITPTISAPNADRLTWAINGNEVSGASYALSQLGTGTFNLTATATWDTVDAQGRASQYSKTSTAVPFLVKDLNPPTINIGFPDNNMVLKTGERYQFSAQAESASAIRESWWEVDGTRLPSNTYTPPLGMTKKVVTIAHHAINADGIKGTATRTVNIVDPAAYLSAPTETEYLVGSTIPINGSVVDAELFWLINGAETPSWNKIFTNTGRYTVQVGWRKVAIGSSGSSETFTGTSSNSITLDIYSNAAPVITAFSPSNPSVRVAVNAQTNYSVSATSENQLQTTVWRVLDENGGVVWEGAVGNTFLASFSNVGQYTLQANVIDNKANSTRKEWTVKVIDPSIEITYPQNGLAFGLNAVPNPVVVAQELVSYEFYLDGATVPVAEGFNWNSLVAANHTLYAVGYYRVSDKAELQSVTSNTVNFRVEDRTPPSFTIQGIRDGDRIIAGQPYTFTVTRENNETLEWFRNGTKIPGTSTQLTFTPLAGDNEITFTVRGKLNNITAERTFRVRVIDPFINIVLPTALAHQGLYPPNRALPLQYEGRNIDRVQWTIDGQPFSGQSVSFDPGNHTIAISALATGVRLSNGNYGDYEPTGTTSTTTREIAVAEITSITGITAPRNLYTGEPLNVSVTTIGDNDGMLIASLTYSVDGRVYRQETSPVSKSAQITGLSAGSRTITVTAVDVFGNRSSRETTVTINRPLVLSITQPTAGARISPDTNVIASAAVTSGQYTSLSWSVDGSQIPNSNFLTGAIGRLSPGPHTISVQAVDPVGSRVAESVQVEVQSDFQLNLLAPARGSEIIVGNAIQGMVGVDRVAGSQIDLSDAARYISWWVNGSDTGRRGLTYTFTGSEAGESTIQARYEKDGMERFTSERTIIVRDIATPVINQPLNGASLIYSSGDLITLSASGEPGAAFSWILNGNVVAVGREATFNPNGITGQQQLKLETTAHGRTKDRMVSFTLALNTPPTLSLSAPRTQFTGDRLTWAVNAFDVEDQISNPPVDLFLDGIPLDTDASRILGTNDIGQHTLMARTTDSHGVSTSRQVGITVEPSQLALEIQSPQQGETYFVNFAIPLRATIATTGNPATDSGTFRWEVQYLDDPSIPLETFAGSSASINPQALGDVAITARYTDANGKQRASVKKNITVAPEPVELSIYWPHGTIVNAGAPLSPEVIGLPAGTTQEPQWTINGSPIDTIANLTAPDVSGNYTLTVQHSDNGATSTASIGFSVNGIPKVTITSPIAGGQYVSGNPLVLSARVEDDRPYTGTVQWRRADGTVIGEGNPFILTSETLGETLIVARVVDRYGAMAENTLRFTIYNPVSQIGANVNGGSSTYLITINGAPLPAQVEYQGGINAQAYWTLQQGARVLEKTGKTVAFMPNELVDFEENAANLTLRIVDAAIADEASREVFRQDYPLVMTRNAIAQITSPASGDVLRIGEPIPIQVALTGFTSPNFAMTVNGVASSSPWLPIEGSSRYQSLIPVDMIPQEGIYELNVTVTENGLVRTVPFALNVYAQRSGIFIDSAPTQYDLESGSNIVESSVMGLTGVESIRWRTDVAMDPVGYGANLDLANAQLVPGERSITVEAMAGTQVLSSFSFLLKVLGPMTLQVTPVDDPLIIQRGADVSLMALARNRDGSFISGETITWTSHLDGLLGNGASLALKNLTSISAGEHIFTVEATGSNGSTVMALKRIQVNAIDPEGTGQPTGSETEGEGDGEGDGSGTSETPPGQSFTQGRPMGQGRGKPQGSFGPGGTPADSGLADQMRNFRNNNNGN